MFTLQVCIAGTSAQAVINRLQSIIDPSLFTLSLFPEGCMAEFILGLSPAQSDSSIKQVYFLSNEDTPPIEGEVKILPASPDLADQLLLTTLQAIRYEQALHEANGAKLNAEARLKTVLTNNSDILTLLDASGKVIFQSASIKQKMGYSENELEGKSLFEFIHPDDIELVMAEFRNAMQTEGVCKRVEFRLRDKNGEYLYLEAIGNNQLQNPLIQAFVVHSHDISDRKREEKERNLLIQELSKQNSDLKQFAYITTHNLRGPFTNLQALYHMLEPNVPIPTDIYSAINRSMNMLEETLNDLIRLLFIKEVQTVSIKPIAIQSFLSNLLHWQNPLIEQTQTQITLRIPENATVSFYEPYLREIIEQLLRNAIQFSHQHQPPAITISLTQSHEHWQLQIADNGLGFDYEKVKERIFGFYQRFHSESTGKGMGLLLAQTQAKACNSHLSCESTIGVGSIFTLSIPRLPIGNKKAAIN